MGTVRTVVEQVDQTPEKKKEIGESLDILMELCQLKGESYQKTIEDSLTTGKIAGSQSIYLPITHVIKKQIEYRCITKDTPKDITGPIADSIKNCFKEKTPDSIIDGVTNLLKSGLDIILGSGEGAETEFQQYTCCLDGSGEIPTFVRIDMMIWGRNISTASLKETMENAFTVVFYKSILDVSKISFMEFANLYSDILDSGIPDGPDKQKRILDAIANAKDTFNELVNDEKAKEITHEDLKNIKPMRISNFTRIR